MDGLMQERGGVAEGKRIALPSAALHRVVTEAMTIRETSFFRDVLPFRLLRDVLLPKLIEARSDERRLRMWSAGCSTGQEAYSVAMLLRERFPEIVPWDVKILGTDISQVACDAARRGRYSRLEIHRGLPARLRLRYFQRVGDEWEVSDALRSMVTFERGDVCDMNVAAQSSGVEMFDVVFLRNVLLYFAEEDRGRALKRVHERMHPDGVLLLGNGEQAEDSSDLFRVKFEGECYFYRPIATG